MSEQLYQVLALASRYLFALLGILIVLRAFFWLLTDHAHRRQRLRRLPNAGIIGELVALTGSAQLPEGAAIAIPWEGILGSVRSSDVIVPCAGVGRRHLSFSYDPEKGLLLRPFSGCEALVNERVINCHSRPEDFPMKHGSYLQMGDTLLRLRIFAGLDPSAGFEPSSAGFTAQAPSADAGPQQPLPISPFPQPSSGSPPASIPQDALRAEITNGQPGSVPFENTNPLSSAVTDQPSALPSPGAETGTSPSPAPAGPRRRRSDRWEVDWSE